MAATMSAYIGTGTRVTENVQWSWLARPQSMTIYIRFLELGNILLNLNQRLFTLGSSSALAMMWVTGGSYRFRHANKAGATSTTGVIAAPSRGDVVELRGTISATGVATLHQSINGAAETTSTSGAAVTFADAWVPMTLWINSNNVAQVGYVGINKIRFVRGVHSLATMRRYAGVS